VQFEYLWISIDDAFQIARRVCEQQKANRLRCHSRFIYTTASALRHWRPVWLAKVIQDSHYIYIYIYIYIHAYYRRVYSLVGGSIDPKKAFVILSRYTWRQNRGRALYYTWYRREVDQKERLDIVSFIFTYRGVRILSRSTNDLPYICRK